MKKILLIFMNCLGEELINYFNSIPEIYNNYIIKMISTYDNLNNDLNTEIENSDILITNNIKNYPNYTYDNLSKIVKKTAINE